MTYLKFYRNEKEKFPNQNKTHIPDKNVSKFAQKIARHFKVSLRAIRLRGYRGSAIAHCGICEIGLSHNPTVLLIIHEIGHLYTWQKLNEAKHNKNLMLFIKRACRYAEKMGYWSLEIKNLKYENMKQHEREYRPNPLMIIPETEKALAIPETKAITVYKIPLGCA